MKSKLIKIIPLIFIMMLLGTKMANAAWLFYPDGSGYFATTSNGDETIFCAQMGGTLGTNTLRSGLVKDATQGDFCSYCEGSATKPAVSTEDVDVAYTYEYSSTQSIDVYKHQDVAYALATSGDQEKIQTVIWKTDLNTSGIKTWAEISGAHNPSFDDGGLYEEAYAYREFYEKLQADGGFITSDNTDYSKVKTAVNQDDDTYTVGKYKIDYSNGIYTKADGSLVYFGYISSMKLKNQKDSELTIIDILDSNGDSIMSRTYPMPKNNEEFYIKFKYDGTGTTTSVYLDIEFTYLEKCEASMQYWKGKKYEWAWGKQNSGRSDHHHGCGYTSHSHTSSCGTSPSYSSCSGGNNSNWQCNTYTAREWVLKKGPSSDCQVLLGVKKVSGAEYWAKKVWNKAYLSTKNNIVDITMDIEGIVFLDIASGKSTVNSKDYNGRLESIDKRMANIEVTLYEEDGTLVQVIVGTNSTLTDSDGHFIFKKLNAQKKYYITYKFNGQKYENSTYKVAIADYNTDEWKVTSKASIFDSDRESFNKKFELINSSPGNYTNINNITGFNLSSNKTYKIFEQTDDVGTSEYNDMETLQNAIYEKIKNFISSNGRYPNSDSDKKGIYQEVANEYSGMSEVKNKIQYIVDTEVIAKTGYKSSMQYYPVYNQFVIDTNDRTIGSIEYKALYNGQKYINLGLMEREKLDLTLYKDLEEITIYINNKRFVYEYKSREGEMDITLNESDIHNKYSEYELKSSAGRGTDISDRVNGSNVYERNIRESDIAYISYLASDASRDYSKRIRIFATYRIRVKNFTDGQITANITELKDHFDNSYTFDNNIKSSVITYDVLARPSVVETSDNKYELVKTAGDYLSWSSTTNGNPTNTITTTDSKMKNISLKTAQYFDIYNMFEVKTEAIKNLLDTGNSTKENYAQIAGYKSYYTNKREYSNEDTINDSGYVAGLVDRDSRPGDFNANNEKVQDFVKYTYTSAFKSKSGEQKTKESKEIFEDDADKAPGINLKVLSEYRVLKGNVWEDKVLKDKLEQYNIRQGDGENNDSQPIKDLRVQLIDMDIISVNSYSNYNTITDIYHIGSALNNGYFVQATTLTDANGNYQFNGYIPGNYLVRFIYGEDTLLTTSGNSGKVYEGQDYKSTLYTESDHQYINSENKPIYWYEKTKSQKKSDAQDNLVRRNEINGNNKTMNFHVANVLNYYENKTAGYKSELEERSKIFADTEKLVLEVEYVQTRADYSKDEPNKVYVVENVDLGLVERPRQELTLTKDIANIRIIANSGQTIFDAEKQESNLAWIEPLKQITGNYNTNHDRNGMIQATVDNNLMHGATVKILYKISIENTGEKDYILSDGTVDKNFYNTAIPLSTAKLATTKADCIIDYIENNLKFSNELDAIDKDKKYNQYWKLVIGEDNKGNKTNELNTVLQTGNDSLIDPNLKTTVEKYNAIIRTTDNSPLLYNLIPTDKRGERKEELATETNPTTKTQTTLLLTKVLDTSDNSSDNFIYNNGLEIIQTSNEVGRRHYNNIDKSRYNEDDQITKIQIISSIPGDYVPTNAGDSTRDQSVVTSEPDSDYAERVTILPPFGQKNTIIIIVSSIIAIIILGIGIFIIKKKVLKK